MPYGTARGAGAAAGAPAPPLSLVSIGCDVARAAGGGCSAGQMRTGSNSSRRS